MNAGVMVWVIVDVIKLKEPLKKYGKDNFYYKVLTFCSTQSIADYYETYFIEKYNSVNKGYNICIIGTKSPMFKRKHSEKSKIKMSKSRKGTFVGNNNPFFGKFHSEKSKENISKSIKEYYEYNTHPWTGKFHKNSTKKKLSEIGKGQRRSINTEFKSGKVWEPNSSTKLNIDITNNIRKDHAAGMLGIEIAVKYKLSRASVSRILNDKAWLK
jgi:group I intron endonuclease